MSVVQGTQVARGLVLALGLIAAGCGSSAEPEESSDSNSNPSIPVVGNYPAAGAAGQASSSDGFKGWRSDAAGSSAGKGAAAGSSGAVAAGSSGAAAGSGGSAGALSAAGAGGAAGTAPAAGSGGDSSTDDDPLGLFGPSNSAPSCEGLICVEDQDCKDLYPEESAACKFTKCVDFACK